VVIDITGRTTDGTEFLHLDELRILLDAESTDPAPGFAEAIVGMKADEQRTFTLTLPDEFPREDLRNQEAEFTVIVKEVYDSTLPNLDDDLARTVGNYETIKELEKHVKEQLRQAAQDEADEEYAEQTVEAIIDQAQVEYPPVMMEETLDDVVKEIEQAVKRETRLSLEDYLRFQSKTMEDLRSEWEPRAAARLKRGLVLGEIIHQEGLEVDQEEISTHIGEVSARWGEQADEVRASLSSDAGSRAVRNQLLVEKAIQRLVAIARGEAPELGATEEQESEAGDKEQEAGSKEVGE
jgi:trigger factor